MSMVVLLSQNTVIYELGKKPIFVSSLLSKRSSHTPLLLRKYHYLDLSCLQHGSKLTSPDVFCTESERQAPENN